MWLVLKITKTIFISQISIRRLQKKTLMAVCKKEIQVEKVKPGLIRVFNQ